MGGATVDLSGNNSKLNAAADQSKQKIVGAAESGGKAFTKAFSDGEIALGKMIIKASLLKKAVEAVASAALGYANRQSAVSEKYGGQKFDAEVSAAKANIGTGTADSFLSGSGAATASDRIGLLQTLGNSPADRYAAPSAERDKSFSAVAELFQSGLVSQEEAINAFRSGESGITYLRDLVKKRYAALSPQARAELATRGAVEALNRQSGGSVSAGNVQRVITAAGEKRQREEPGAYSVIDAAGMGQSGEALSRTLGAPDGITELQKSIQQQTKDLKQVAQRPNYSASDGK